MKTATITAGDIVKYAKPVSAFEAAQRFVALESYDSRLRLRWLDSGFSIAPTSIEAASHYTLAN